MRAWALGVVVVAAACGGGGAGPPRTDADLSGTIRVLAAAPLVSAPLRPSPADREPNDTAAQARLLRGDAAGTADAAGDPVDVFRVVAASAGPLAASLDAAFDGEVLLHDLETGATAAGLEVAAGAVVDVVVTARRGGGPYRVALEAARGDGTRRPLPAGYDRCGAGHVPGEIVAGLAPGTDPDALARAAGLRCMEASDGLCRLGGAGPGEGFADLCALLARCARLEADGWVRYAEPNYRRRLAGLPDDPLFPQQWALAQVRMPAAWEDGTGADLVVATVDSGIRMHPDLVPNLVAGHDFQQADEDPTDTNTSFSHGTQVAGIIGAAGNNGVGVSGVLWRVRVMPVRAFDAAGFGSAFAIANAIRFAAGLPNSSGRLPAEAARVINLSFAADDPTQSEEQACRDARDAGVLLVGAAGNQGRTAAHYPAAYPSVLAVAATDRSGSVTDYSNSGSWIDLAAPGGTFADGVRTCGVDRGGSYTYPAVNGTSFAAPHVSGVAALLFSLGAPSPDVVEQVLRESAQDIGAAGRDDRSGHGVLDAHGAVIALLQRPEPVLLRFEEVHVRLLRWPSRVPELTASTSEVATFAFAFSAVPPGDYLLEAGTDRNFDGILDAPGEVYGAWRDGDGGEVLRVVAGMQRTDLDFAIEPR